jgi:hypothetical protein
MRKRAANRRDGRVGGPGADDRRSVGPSLVLTPVATPANLMVMEPGGYRFGD